MNFDWTNPKCMYLDENGYCYKPAIFSKQVHDGVSLNNIPYCKQHWEYYLKEEMSKVLLDLRNVVEKVAESKKDLTLKSWINFVRQLSDEKENLTQILFNLLVDTVIT